MGKRPQLAFSRQIEGMVQEEPSEFQILKKKQGCGLLGWDLDEVRFSLFDFQFGFELVLA